jgi:hypothetical protein
VYGKIFESMYEGSLYGQWEAIVTMQQFIVIANQDGVVDMTTRAIAAKTSIPIGIIEKGIDQLSAPDEESRTLGHNGVRIELIDEHRRWGWVIVNYQKYMKVVRLEDKRKADRERIANKRATEASKNEGGSKCRGSSHVVRNVAHIDVDVDVKTIGRNSDEFDRFWNMYGKKVKKKNAVSAFNRLSHTDVGALMTHLPERIQDPQFKNFTPDPSTFINQRRWEDEDWKTERKQQKRTPERTW